jgi:hypothetical protein
MVAYNRKIAGSDIPVVSGKVGSRISAKKRHHARNKTRKHFRAEEGQSILGPTPDLAHMAEVLRADRDHWVKAKDSKGHNKKGQYLVSSAKPETIALLESLGLNCGPRSRKDIVEPLVAKHITEARPYREPEHEKKVRPLKEKANPASGKGARASLGQITPGEVQYVRADGVAPLSIPEKKKPVGYDAALERESINFKMGLMRKHGFIVPDVVTNACLRHLAKWYVKVDGKYTLLPAAKDACPYKAGHYKAAWADICNRLIR